MFNVAIVDDSAFVRKAVKHILGESPFVESVYAATTGEEYLKHEGAWVPDVVLLDLDMPGMGGLATIDQIMLGRRTPVIVFSQHAGVGAPLTIESLHRGASDFIDKQSYSLTDFEALGAVLMGKICQVLGYVGELKPDDFDLEPVLEHQGIPVPKGLSLTVEYASKELIRLLRARSVDLCDILPRQFEEVVAEILSSRRWDVELTASTRDGGFDIFAISGVEGGERTSWIIECKRYARHRRVGIDVVRSLYTAKRDTRAANVMIATTSDFTSGVREYQASRYDLSLRDHDAVLGWIDSYQPRTKSSLWLP